MAKTTNWLDVGPGDKVVALGTFETEAVVVPRGMRGQIEGADRDNFNIKFDGVIDLQTVPKKNHNLAGVSTYETTGFVDNWKTRFGFGKTYDDEAVHFHNDNFLGGRDTHICKGALLAFTVQQEAKGLSARDIRVLIPDGNSCIGEIATYNATKRIGFIASQQRAGDTFFHERQYRGRNRPAAGCLVTFSVRQGQNDHPFEAYDVFEQVRLGTAERKTGAVDKGFARHGGKGAPGTVGKGKMKGPKGGDLVVCKGWTRGTEDDYTPQHYQPYQPPARLQFEKIRAKGTPDPKEAEEKISSDKPTDDWAKFCDTLTKGAAIFKAKGAAETRIDPATSNPMTMEEFVSKYKEHGAALWSTAKK
eukprot:gene9741-17596_t